MTTYSIKATGSTVTYCLLQTGRELVGERVHKQFGAPTADGLVREGGGRSGAVPLSRLRILFMKFGKARGRNRNKTEIPTAHPWTQIVPVLENTGMTKSKSGGFLAIVPNILGT